MYYSQIRDRSRPIPRSRIRAARRSSRPSTAARRGSRCRAFRTAIITRSGSIRTNGNHLVIGNDGGLDVTYDQAETLGVRRTPCRSASSTPSAPTCGSRTSSAAGCRTTAAGAVRARRAAATASSTRTGSASAAATASTRRTIRSDWTILYSESQDGATEPRRSARRPEHQHPSARARQAGGAAPAGRRRRRIRQRQAPAQFGVGRGNPNGNIVPAPPPGTNYPLLLEHAVHPVAAQPAHDLSRRRSAVPFVQPRRHVDGVARPDQEHRPQRSADHGRGRQRRRWRRSTTAPPSYSNIITIGESPVVPGVIWVGTNDGNVQVSRDGGNTWKNVADKVPGVPKETHVSRVEASHFDAGTALRHLRRASHRRSQAVRVQDHRLRRDVDVDCRQPARRATST